MSDFLSPALKAGIERFLVGTRWEGKEVSRIEWYRSNDDTSIDIHFSGNVLRLVEIHEDEEFLNLLECIANG